MSTRHFCDSCGTEFVGTKQSVVAPHNRLSNGAGGVMFSITAGFNEMGQGEVCKYCVLDAVARLDDRPKAARVQAAPEEEVLSK